MNYTADKLIKINYSDISKETEDFLLDERADWIPTLHGGLYFTKGTLETSINPFIIEEDEDIPEKVISDIKKLVAILEKENASLVYLCT